jgi:hypothetical protein
LITQKLDVVLKDLQTSIEHSKILIAESTALIDAVKQKRNGKGSSRKIRNEPNSARSAPSLTHVSAGSPTKPARFGSV